MRAANIDGRMAVQSDERWIDVATASNGRFPSEPLGVIDEWEAFREWWSSIRVGELDLPSVSGDFGPPVPDPRQVFGIGLNYRGHAIEANLPIPERPVVFTKFRSSLCGHNELVVLPTESIDWEVELVVVIGRHGRHIAEADAWNHIAGLTVGQDLSDRALQLGGPVPQFSLGKSYPGFGPIGPVLVTPDEFANPDDLELRCDFDGECLQLARTGDLIFSVPAIVAHLSSVLPLLPGDVIFTGTPGGVGMGRTPPRYLKPGLLTSHIEHIGTLAVQLMNREDVSYGDS